MLCGHHSLGSEISSFSPALVGKYAYIRMYVCYVCRSTMMHIENTKMHLSNTIKIIVQIVLCMLFMKRSVDPVAHCHAMP